jgi:hypothetical protein
MLIEDLKYPGWTVYEKSIRNKKTGSYFAFRGFQDIRAARSTKGYYGFDGLVVDEAEGVSKESWIMATPTFRKPGSEIWAIFNRYEEFDPVHEMFCLSPDLKTITEDGYSRQENDTTMVIECNWRDNPWFPDVLYQEMMQMKKDDYDLYLHVYENHPIAQVEDAVISRKLVDQAVNRKDVYGGFQTIGVDVARHGNDKTKAYELRGNKCRKLLERKHEEPIDTANKLAHKADNEYTIFNIDNGGLGAGGMIARLRELGFKNVNEINFGGRAKDYKQYANVVTEMYFECKKKLESVSIPNDKFLKQDLTGRKYGYKIIKGKVKKVLEKKADFKKRYHRSPDDGDGCVLALYEPSKIDMSGKDKRQKKQNIKKRIIRNRRRFIK